MAATAARVDSAAPVSGLPVIASLLAVYFAWGSTYLAIRFALVSLPPFLLAGLRGVVAGALLVAWGTFRGQAVGSREALFNAALAGVLLVAGGNGLVTYAEQWVSSGLAASIAGSGAIWIVLLLALLGEKATPAEQAGIAIGFVGIVLLNLEDELVASPGAALAMLAATWSWAFGSVITRRRVLPEGALGVGYELLFGGVVMTLFGLAIGERIDPARLEPKAVAAWCYLVVAGSLIGFSAFTYLIRNVRPALATSFVYVNPVVAVFLGVALAGEHISGRGYAGVAISVVGLAVVTLASRARR